MLRTSPSVYTAHMPAFYTCIKKRFRTRQVNRIPLTALFVLVVCSAAACDGAAVQLCGRYACVNYQSSQSSRCDFGGRCFEVRQCESAGSIRDRAPRIINELRQAQRTCSSASTQVSDALVVWDEDLASASTSHSIDMARNRFESFTGTNGTTSTDRVSLTGFNASLVLESIGSGPQTSAEMINFWLDIPTDCNQLLSSDTSRVGMACTLSNAPDSQPFWSLVLAEPGAPGIQQ